MPPDDETRADREAKARALAERNKKLQRLCDARIADEMRHRPTGPLARVFRQMRRFAASPASDTLRKLAQEAARTCPAPGSPLAKTFEIIKEMAEFERANQGKLNPLDPRNFGLAAAQHGINKTPHRVPTDQETLSALAEYKRLHPCGRRDACKAVAHELGIKAIAVDQLYSKLSEELRRPGRRPAPPRNNLKSNPTSI